MRRSIVRSALAATLLATVLVGSGGQAHAGAEIKNGTANTVWVSHAFSSTQRFLCGWDDGCAESTSSGWRVEGWWMIALVTPAPSIFMGSATPITRSTPTTGWGTSGQAATAAVGSARPLGLQPV